MYKKAENHPSYGMLGFCRTRRSSTHLFGSSIQHKNTIVMTLKHGELNRQLNEDYYFGREVIAEVEMSFSQFAEAITAINVGDGVPCTIRFTEKDGAITESPFISKQEQFENEFNEHLDNVKQETADTIEEIKQIFEKKSIGKGDREQILRKLEQLEMQIGSNTNFIYKQFNRQMEKTVMEAKGEIESFCQNKINSIAQAALVEQREDIMKLENPVDIDME